MESEKPKTKVLRRYTESQGLTVTQKHLQALEISSFVAIIFHLLETSKCTFTLNLQLLSLLGFVLSIRE